MYPEAHLRQYHRCNRLRCRTQRTQALPYALLPAPVLRRYRQGVHIHPQDALRRQRQPSL